MPRAPYFTEATLGFLNQLAQHNSHAWFRAHKADYEALVREPAQRFITDLQGPLSEVSPHLRADPRKVGGSLFRVMKDTRREHPEGPYKTWIGMQFFHEQRRQVHAPSFFVHLSPKPQDSFVGGGLWRPEPPVLKQVRGFLEENPRAWRQAVDRPVMGHYHDDGEWLTRLPRGYTAQEPLASDLRRKSFTWDQGLSRSMVLSPELPEYVVSKFKDLSPVVDYLCAALDLPF